MSNERRFDEMNTAVRTEAFAAIRRAAKVARGLDKAATVRDFLSDYQMDCRAEAAAIRRAIRAAIGSEKA